MPVPESERASRDDWVFDTVLAILAVTFVLAPYLVTIAFYGPVSSGGSLLAAAVTGLALSASFILRRHYPLPFLAVVALLCLLHVILVPLPFTLLITVPVAIYGAARYVSQNTAWVLFFWIPAAVAATLRWFLHYDRTNASTMVSVVGGFAFVGIVVTAYTIGRRGHDLAVASERARLQELEQSRVDRRELDGDQQTSYAAAANMAADLYDAFADTISHIIVQSDQANVLVGSDHPQEAVAKMSLVAATGREVLADLRAASIGVGSRSLDEGTGEIAAGEDGVIDEDDGLADYDDGPMDDGRADDYPEAEEFDEADYSWDDARDDDGDDDFGLDYPGGEYLGDTPESGPDEAVPARALVDYPPVGETEYPASRSESVVAGDHLPSTGADGVPQLTAEAGAEFVETGQPVLVDDMVGVTLFRIVEEALDNARQHAGPNAEPQVHLDWGDDDVEVSVTNRPTGYRSRPSATPGEGLSTMAERATAINGLLEAGPTEDGGYMVWAKLPYDWQSATTDAEWDDDDLAVAGQGSDARSDWADAPQAGWAEGQRAYQFEDEPVEGSDATTDEGRPAATTGEWEDQSGWDAEAAQWTDDGTGTWGETAPWAEDWAEATPAGARRPLVAETSGSADWAGEDWAEDGLEPGGAEGLGRGRPRTEEDWRDEEPGAEEPGAWRQSDGDYDDEELGTWRQSQDSWDDGEGAVQEPHARRSSEDGWDDGDGTDDPAAVEQWAGDDWAEDSAGTAWGAAADDWADDDAEDWEAAADEWVESDDDWEAASWASGVAAPAPRQSSDVPARPTAAGSRTAVAPAVTVRSAPSRLADEAAAEPRARRTAGAGSRETAGPRPVAATSRSAPAPRSASSSRQDQGAQAAAPRQGPTLRGSAPASRQPGSRAAASSASTSQRSGGPSRQDAPRPRPRI